MDTINFVESSLPIFHISRKKCSAAVLLHKVNWTTMLSIHVITCNVYAADQLSKFTQAFTLKSLHIPYRLSRAVSFNHYYMYVVGPKPEMCTNLFCFRFCLLWCTLHPRLYVYVFAIFRVSDLGHEFVETSTF